MSKLQTQSPVHLSISRAWPRWPVFPQCRARWPSNLHGPSEMPRIHSCLTPISHVVPPCQRGKGRASRVSRANALPTAAVPPPAPRGRWGPAAGPERRGQKAARRKRGWGRLFPISGRRWVPEPSRGLPRMRMKRLFVSGARGPRRPQRKPRASAPRAHVRGPEHGGKGRARFWATLLPAHVGA